MLTVLNRKNPHKHNIQLSRVVQKMMLQGERQNQIDKPLKNCQNSPFALN